MKHGLNMAVRGAALGLLHSLGRKLAGLIKLHQNLKHFNDNKGKTSLIIQRDNNWVAEGNHWAANWLAQAGAKHCWLSHLLLQESGSTFAVWLWPFPYTASEWLWCWHCPKCPRAQVWEIQGRKATARAWQRPSFGTAAVDMRNQQNGNKLWQAQALPTHYPWNGVLGHIRPSRSSTAQSRACWLPKYSCSSQVREQEGLRAGELQLAL